MSVSMMERVAEAARTLARNAQAEEGRSFRGFRQNTEQLTDRLISAMFPSYAAASLSRESALLEASELLIECLDRVLPVGRDPEAVAGALFAALPEVQRQLQTDLAAAYEGDPAAASVDEIILCYPAFPAIAAYRLAHVLYLEKVPLLPRMMTEYAHRTTGIDIHPGATIGDSFFIDHGTGVDRRGHRRDHHHRGAREAVPARDVGRQELRTGPRREPGEGHQAAPGHRG